MPLTCLHKEQYCEGENCRTFQECAKDEEFCVAIGYMNQTTNKSEILYANCNQCTPKSTECIGQIESVYANVTHYKCCCSQSNCNKFMKIQQFPNYHKTEKENQLLMPILLSVILLLLLSFIIVIIVLLRKRICKSKQKENGFKIENGNATNGVCNVNHVNIMNTDETVIPLINDGVFTSSNIKSDDIHLIEKISLGPLSTVYKGTFANNQTQTKIMCAVKIFSNAEKAAASQLWKNEKDIYSYLSNSEYMTKFIAALERVNDLNMNEYWLLTEYQQNGSLYDYLKRTKLNWQLTCNFALSILEGLAYLHTESTSVNKTKPSIAHRDLKSKNILVKSNGTCCITDFGLAVALKSSKLTSIDVRSQVGTKRYMSPELLEGAIQFTKETLVRIDVYSCALVLWEVISRGDFYSVNCDVYELPYESDVGKDPSIDDMQRLVVVQKKRPSIRPEWQQHEGVKKIIQTIEECWDTDVAARITSQCAAVRLEKQMSIVPILANNTPNNIEPTII